MISPFYLIALEGIAAQSSLWNEWTDKISDAFGYANEDDSTDADSFVDMLWSQLNFGVATSSSSTAIFDSWLTGVEFDNYLSGITSQLTDLRATAGDTSNMNTSQIVAAINKAGFNSTAEGWANDVDLENVLEELYTMAVDLEALSFSAGMDLSVFPSLGGLESVLNDYGYEDLYTLEDINKFLDERVGSEIPDSYTEYQSNLQEIEDMLADIIAGEDDAADIVDVLSKMTELIDKLQAEVDGGNTNLKDALDDLTLAYEVLSMFGKTPTDILLDLSEDLLSLFTETNFDYDGLDSELGDDWLSSFVSVMQEIYAKDNNEYEVCPDNFIQDILISEYSWRAYYAVNCPLVILGQTPSCTCLNNAGIYGNEDKEAVLASMNCRFDEDDDLTVQQILRQCNGEVIEDTPDDKDAIQDAFETLEGLTDLLTEDNYGSNLVSDKNITELSSEFQEIIDAMEVLSDTEIVSDGTDEDYEDSVSDYLENFNTLVSDLDMDGTYSDEGQSITDIVNSAYNSFFDGDESSEPQEPTKSGSSIPKWVWVIVALGSLACLFGAHCCYIRRKNNKLDRIAVETEIEGFGGQYMEPLPAKTAVTSEEGEI